MSPEESIESAARALYYRDHEEQGVDPLEEWESASEEARAVYRAAVSEGEK